MAETVADIAIGVTADIGPLMRETARAEAALGKFDRVVQGVGRGFSDFGGKATALGARMSIATAAIGAAAGAAIAITRSAADAGEAIANGAKAANMSTTAFQEYRYALSEAADMSGEEFADASVKLNKRLGEAMAGSRSAQAAFEKLGISQADLAAGTVTGDTAMAALVKTLETTTDPAIAAAIATEVLGKSGARMGGMLAGTAGTVDALRESARSLGIVMSKDAVEASDKFNEKWDATVKQFEAVKIAIATQLMPIIVNELLPLIQEKVIPVIVSIINKIGEWVTAFQELPAPVQSAIEIVAGLFAVGGPLLLAIGVTASVIGALVAAAGPIGLLIVAAGLLTAAWLKWGDEFKAIIGGAIDWVTGKFTAFMALIDGVIGKLKSWKDTAADFIGAGDPSTFTPNPNYKPDPMSNIGGGVDRLGGGAGHDQLGIDMADGMVNGMTARLSERSSEIAAAINTIPQIARDQLGIQSPSTVFAEIGGNIGAGLAQGISASAAVVAASIQTVNSGAVTSTKGMVSETLGVLGQLFQGSKAIAAAQAVVNAWAGATEALKLPFPANLLAFGKVLATGLSAVSAIKGTSIGSSGSGSASAPSIAAPQSVANITLNGDTFSRDSLESLFSQINQGLKTGRTINLVGV